MKMQLSHVSGFLFVLSSQKVFFKNILQQKGFLKDFYILNNVTRLGLRFYTLVLCFVLHHSVIVMH